VAKKGTFATHDNDNVLTGYDVNLLRFISLSKYIYKFKIIIHATGVNENFKI
jgi:hypothetical protein